MYMYITSLFLTFQVSTTLVSMTDEETLEKNIKAALNPLGAREAKIKDFIMQHYFLPLKVKHWEGVEIAKYRHKLQKSSFENIHMC